MKATWTKVYSGPGYPIDPKRESERNAISLFDFVPCHPNDVLSKFLQAINEGLILPETATFQKCDCPDCNPRKEVNYLFPECDPNHPVAKALSKDGFLLMDDYYDALMKHGTRDAMVKTEDFQSRLMAIEVKERGI